MLQRYCTRNSEIVVFVEHLLAAMLSDCRAQRFDDALEIALLNVYLPSLEYLSVIATDLVECQYQRLHFDGP